MSDYEIYRGKTVLITGGTGSFGQHFVRFLLERTEVKKVIVFSRDEYKQHLMEKKIKDERTRFFLGDVRDKERLQRAFSGVDIVLHAAALKQVPLLEYNPYEAVKTNVLGSQNVIDAALDQGVEKALLISSDKAAHPVNLYGATKLCAEKLFVDGNVYSGRGTSFSCVRYGNVVGSRGSIVEALLQNRSAEKVYITDERMTRFWITLEQAYNLVTFTLTQMEGGEIFIPRIPSMKVVELFDVLVPQARREVIGVRPGEKVHEDLLTPEEARHAVEYGGYFVVLSENKFLDVEDRYQKYFEQGRELDAEFRFASHTNDQWLTRDQLEELIRELQ